MMDQVRIAIELLPSNYRGLIGELMGFGYLEAAAKCSEKAEFGRPEYLRQFVKTPRRDNVLTALLGLPIGDLAS